MARGEPLLWLLIACQVFSSTNAGDVVQPVTPPKDLTPAPGLVRFGCTKNKASHNIDATVPGEIVSPGYPNSYSDNENCTWILRAPLGNVIRLTIKLLQLHHNDVLTISDGNTPLARNLIGKYSLCMKETLSLFSTGRDIHISFTSDDKEVDKGFKVEYKTVRKDKIIKEGKVNKLCSFLSVVRGTSGYVAHPEFPGAITDTVQCIWNIKGTSGKDLFLSYKMMGLIPETPFGSCEFDYVRQKHVGQSQTAGFCGCSLPDNTKGTKGKDAFLQLRSTDRVTNYNQPGFLVYFKAMDPSTCPDPKNCAALEDDRNIGFDRDGNIMFEKKEEITTTSAPTTRLPTTEPPMGPFQVECYRDEMRVALNFTRYPLLVQESATLIDRNCKSYYEDPTHVYIKTPLDQCGTYHNYSSDGRYIIYYNEILIDRLGVKPGDIITRDHVATFQFECKYHRRAVMSVVHFTPAKARVYTMTENFGNFTYMMRIFKTKDYKEAQEKYPVQVLAGKMVYIQTEVQANDTELVLFVENCKVTPSKDYNDKEYHELIEEGCESDETLEYKHKPDSAVQRFEFKAFYFEKDKDASVHIHCKVRVCRKQDKNSRCAEGCYKTRRKRAVVDAKKDTDITGTLRIGPLEVQQDSQTGQLRRSDSPRMFVQITVGVLGFIVFALLIAVSTVLWKRRQQRDRSQLSLIVEEN